ncbi:MAG: type II toxin-antitoxin system HipA family toxin [Saprospiraceae bacterium]
MDSILDVYLKNIHAGVLRQDNVGQISFTYNEQYLENKGAQSLSQSLPLRKETFDFRECRAFFSGILPEGEIREIIARKLGISQRNDFSMLERIGGECAGAITFLPPSQKLISNDYEYRTLSTEELGNILKELPNRPLMAGEKGIRLSLAGAQNKLAVHKNGEVISIPLGNAPSTHILKPSNKRFEGMVFNEALCMGHAAAIGLNTAKVEIGRVEDTDYILVERYDRSILSGKNDQYERLHQEDFCQALGIVSERKYQKEGGPSLKDCFKLLREISNTPLIDLQRLLDMVIFNYVVGNHDAHGKNFSLLYEAGEKSDEIKVRLAPFYDIVCTDFYPELDKHLAMEIGGKYISTAILPKHFEKFADDTGLAKRLVKQRVREIAGLIIENIPNSTLDHPIAKEISDLIIRRAKLAFDQFKS